MNQNLTGCLYGIGVGPGERGLMTLQAVETLKRVKTIFVPKSAVEKESLALEIARPYLRADSRIATLLFPMTKDKEHLADHWRRAAIPVAAALSAADCGFLTLGDPMLFSTFIYLAEAVRAIVPTAAIESIPGISAVFAAASRSMTPLAEGDESIAVITGDKIDSLQTLAGVFATIVIMKVGKRLPEIKRCLRGLGLEKNAVLVHRIGLDGELVAGVEDVEEERLGYLSTIILRTGR